MGGLRYESAADMPAGMRKLVAVKIGSTGLKQKPIEKTENKYRNQKTRCSNIKFDSKKEARRFQYLLSMQEREYIKDLRLQVEFLLQPAYTRPDGERIRAIRYMADFTYKVGDFPPDLAAPEDREYWGRQGPGAYVVEDVKSMPTRTEKYIMKKKMMEDRFGISIREV